MALSGDGGKGYGRRPNLVSNETVQNNWDSIFGKTQPAKPVDDDPLNVYNEERLVLDKEEIDAGSLDRKI